MKATQFVVFVHLLADASWLRLSRSERQKIVGTELSPIFEKYPNITHQHFDAEAFSAKVSDIELLSAPNAEEFYMFFEEFRDSALIANQYFSVVDIYPTIADGYKEFERRNF